MFKQGGFDYFKMIQKVFKKDFTQRRLLNFVFSSLDPFDDKAAELTATYLDYSNSMRRIAQQTWNIWRRSTNGWTKATKILQKKIKNLELELCVFSPDKRGIWPKRLGDSHTQPFRHNLSPKLIQPRYATISTLWK